MKGVTQAVTEAILVHVPDIEVVSTRIVDDNIHIQTRKASRAGPFATELLAAALTGNYEQSELLKKYNYVTRHLPPGALDDFLEIRRPQVGVSFIQKYGPFAGWTQPQPAFNLGGSKDPDSQIPFSFLQQQREQLSAILWLNKAVLENKKDDIEEATKDAYKVGLNAASDPRKAIAFHLTKHLARSLPALLPFDDGLQSVLICPDVMTGLYGLLLSAIAEKRPYEICENCRELFRTRHSGRRFCSERCQQIAKQRRYREHQNEKSTETAKGASHGRISKGKGRRKR